MGRFAASVDSYDGDKAGARQEKARQNQQQTNSEDQIHYKPGISPAKGELQEVLVRTQKCTGKGFTVTSTNEAVKGHSDIHQPTLRMEEARPLT